MSRSPVLRTRLQHSRVSSRDKPAHRVFGGHVAGDAVFRCLVPADGAVGDAWGTDGIGFLVLVSACICICRIFSAIPRP